MNPEKIISHHIDTIMNTFFIQIESEDTVRPCENSHAHDFGECYQSNKNNPLLTTNPIYHDDI